MPRNVFLEGTTLALGGVIGVLVTLPVLGFTIGPAFLKQGQRTSTSARSTTTPRASS